MNNQKTCFCESGHSYQNCCEPLHLGEPAKTAEALMRSRYSAYVLHLEDYLLKTWHPNNRPLALNLVDDDNTKWLGLSILRSEQLSDFKATVEFVARYKIGGNRAEKLHEISQFEYSDAWYYLSGEVTPQRN
jgi:SEC-C motif-containing protein